MLRVRPCCATVEEIGFDAVYAERLPLFERSDKHFFVAAAEIFESVAPNNDLDTFFVRFRREIFKIGFVESVFPSAVPPCLSQVMTVYWLLFPDFCFPPFSTAPSDGLKSLPHSLPPSAPLR